MKGECFPYTMSAHVVTSRMPVIRYRLEPRALYISPSTVIANFTKKSLRWSIGTAHKSLGEAETCVKAS